VTNPEVLRATLESRGENLLRGLKHMLEDLERGKGRLSIRMTDLDAFEVGKNIATTPGKVVYQNELMQLIQYTPTTETVYKRPLLIVPPWINKFYILDLQPQNSFIRFAVEQGFTVFVISWVNPDEELSHKTFESYMLEGPLAALDAIEQATGEKEVNLHRLLPRRHAARPRSPTWPPRRTTGSRRSPSSPRCSTSATRASSASSSTRSSWRCSRRR
jgi:polyhydroxyalkanoate synthase subunit PhaC